MEGNAAWRVTGFVLRASSCSFLACVENGWRIAYLTALVSCCSAHKNHEGGEHDIMILAAVQAYLLSTTQHRQNPGRIGRLDFILDVYFRV